MNLSVLRNLFQLSGFSSQLSPQVACGNDLAHLQLRIARRADQLARLVISDPATDLALWLQAEEEIFVRGQKGES